MRLELTTPGTTNRYSNQLSYFRHCLEKTFTKSAAESQVKKNNKTELLIKNRYFPVNREFQLGF